MLIICKCLLTFYLAHLRHQTHQWTEQTRPQISPALYHLKFKFSTAHHSSFIFAGLTFEEIFKSFALSKGPDILIQYVIIIASACPVKKECTRTMLECRDVRSPILPFFNLTVKKIKVVQTRDPPIKRHKLHKMPKYFPHIIRIVREILWPIRETGRFSLYSETPG